MAAELQELRQMCSNLCDVRTAHEEKLAERDQEIAKLKEQLATAKMVCVCCCFCLFVLGQGGTSVAEFVFPAVFPIL